MIKRKRGREEKRKMERKIEIEWFSKKVREKKKERIEKLWQRKQNLKKEKQTKIEKRTYSMADFAWEEGQERSTDECNG